MGNHERSSPPNEGVDGPLHLRFGDGVKAGGGLVEQQDRRVLQQRPGDVQPLRLAFGNAPPARAENRLVAFGQFEDFVVNLGGARGGLDFFISGARAAQRMLSRTEALKRKGSWGTRATSR